MKTLIFLPFLDNELLLIKIEFSFINKKNVDWELYFYVE